MCSVVWIVWSPFGSTEMTRIWIDDRGDAKPGPAQLQVGERGKAPAGERDAGEDEEIGESDDHVAL